MAFSGKFMQNPIFAKCEVEKELMVNGLLILMI